MRESLSELKGLNRPGLALWAVLVAGRDDEAVRLDLVDVPAVLVAGDPRLGRQGSPLRPTPCSAGRT